MQDKDAKHDPARRVNGARAKGSDRAEAGGPRRVLVIGDVMTDIIVRPEGPLAPGSDRRAAIVFEPGGSAANQAAWLAHFGVAVDFVARVGAADLAAEAARLEAAGVTPRLVGDPMRHSGRLVALIDPSGERSFLTDRGANEALGPADIPDALVASASHIHISGYSLFAPSPRAAALDVMRRAGAIPVSVDPASAEFLREIGAAAFLDLCRGVSMIFPNEEEAAVLTGADDPETQCARLSRALSARRDQTRRGGLPRGFRRGALAGRRAHGRCDRHDRRRRRVPRGLPRGEAGRRRDGRGAQARGRGRLRRRPPGRRPAAPVERAWAPGRPPPARLMDTVTPTDILELTSPIPISSDKTARKDSRG